MGNAFLHSTNHLLSLVGEMGPTLVHTGRKILKGKMGGRWFVECIAAFLDVDN
jgi:hypothetical protein